MSVTVVRLLFILAGLYDLAIGFTFLTRGPQTFEYFEVPAPNHWGYVQFASLLLMIFGVMFLMIAMRPFTNRNLIFYGILLKAAYCGLVGYYWFTDGVPFMFKPFAIVDAVMLVLFAVAWAALGRQSA